MRLNVFIDSNDLLQVVRGNETLRRNIAIIKQAIEDDKVTNIGWIPSIKMIADYLTRQTRNPAELLAIFQQE